MPRLRECIKERSPIVNLTMLNSDTIAYVTQYAGIKIFDIYSCEQKSKIVCNDLNISTTATCFSPNQKLLAFANNDVLNIVSLESKNIIKTIKLIKDSIENLIFTDDSLYVIVATKNGRILKYKYNNSSLIDRLYSFKYDDKHLAHVSAFAIKHNKLACAGTDGSLFVIDLEMQIRRTLLVRSGKQINAICFIDANKIVSADIGGKIKIHTLDKTKKTEVINAPFGLINHILQTQNKNALLLSSDDSDYICAIDIEKATILKSRYIECEFNVNKMAISPDNLLYVVTRDDIIEKSKLPSISDLKKLIEKNQLVESYELVENEPLLGSYDEYKLLEQKYQLIYNQILSALIEQNSTLALKLSKLLRGIKSKELEITSLFKAFGNYPQLKKFYIEKKYALAYGLVNKCAPLQHTPIFKKLEETFLEAFKNAKRHIELNSMHDAKALMDEYVTVISKRPIIKLLLNKDKDFLNFLKAIEKEDFQKQEELLQHNPMFKLSPTYKTLKQSIEKQIHIIELFIKEGDLLKAKKLLLQFKSTPFMKEKLVALTTKMQAMDQLQKFYKVNDFKNCYELLDTHMFLNDSKLGILLNKHWVSVIQKGENLALNGDIVAVLKQLYDFLEIQTRKNKIGSILRVSSISMIKVYFAKKDYKHAKNIIYSHIDVFGYDSEISLLMEMYERLSKQELAITQGQYDCKSRDSWTKVDILQKYQNIFA